MDALTLALKSPFAFLGVENPWFFDAQPVAIFGSGSP
jgi:FMN-dependent NADH-azoreductase